MEVQDERPKYPIPVESVGYKGVTKRLRINSPEGSVLLDATFDLYVRLLGDRKGAHLSRSVEAANVVESIPEESWSLEALADAVHKELLRLHSYSSNARVVLRTKYWVPVSLGSIRSMEPIDVTVEVSGPSNNKRYSTSVTVKGMTVCPSAETTIKSMLGYSGPAPSHSQRALLRGTITVRKLIVVRVEEIARCLLASFSSPVLSKLKRMDEANLILGAYGNPKFAEDVVREALMNLACHLRQTLPLDSVIRTEIVSLESIHPHNLYAMARGSLEGLPLQLCPSKDAC